MELEAEKTIQEKIRMAEQANVTWNKEWVWSRIDTPVKHKTGFVWYAAAAVVAGLLTISLYWISMKYETNMMAQLNRLELLMDQLPQKTTSIEAVEEKCLEDAAIAGYANTTADKKTDPLAKRIAVVNQTNGEIDSATNLIELPIINIQLPVPDLTSNDKLTKVEPENRIRPIIGKIPNAQNSLASAKTKEIKIQIFQPEESQNSLMTDARDYKILTAHFKNN